jgi:Zn-dependent peptidase ImmA (M78 family)
MLEETRYGYARQAAREVIKKCGINAPPVDIECILNTYGLQYMEVETFPDGLDALFVLIEGVLYVAVNKHHHIHRKRFSAAHELGHRIMNHEVSYYQSVFTIDDPPDKRDHRRTEKIFEQEANAFAGELLVPLAMLKKEFKTTPDIPALAGIFNVSGEVLGIRIFDHMRELYK